MEVRHFITFQTIMKTGTYTAAAKVLGYTQSTLTNHIQSIEKEIGGALFKYENRTLKLTKLGHDLIPLAEDLIATHQKIKQLHQQSKVQGQLIIAAPESLTITRLGPLLKEFSIQYPDVEIILTNGTCSQNQKDVLSGVADVALIIFPEINAQRTIVYNLGEEKMVLVNGADSETSLDNYLTHPSASKFITNEANSTYRMSFESAMKKSHNLSFPTMELWSITAIKQTLINGFGFSYLPLVTVQDEIKSGTLKIVEHQESFTPMHAYILIKDVKWIPLPIEAFVHTAKQFWQKN
ncbi:LysR family transcriptional regulator [Exiguobacterium sp. MMG028]|uniref:LysR family transcriptional regulator n=1 Tax=Exiguobacterium sp. MMG028 TaxID=3021979 RepID=UPI0022FE0627|nr:LysR family transcriptional regulator [Exiguobacterium sp. MMG028]MDA5560663.1 LysR family transcriptional regulator [Exiguobacterium sp. MMG028]